MAANDSLDAVQDLVDAADEAVARVTAAAPAAQPPATLSASVTSVGGGPLSPAPPPPLHPPPHSPPPPPLPLSAATTSGHAAGASWRGAPRVPGTAGRVAPHRRGHPAARDADGGGQDGGRGVPPPPRGGRWGWRWWCRWRRWWGWYRRRQRIVKWLWLGMLRRRPRRGAPARLGGTPPRRCVLHEGAVPAAARCWCTSAGGGRKLGVVGGGGEESGHAHAACRAGGE